MAFDPDELRRRRMLQQGYPMDEVPRPLPHPIETMIPTGMPRQTMESRWDDPDEMQALQMPLGPPDDDQEEDSAIHPINANLSAAQENYKRALGEMPNAQNYQPSKKRRALAMILGGLAGAGGGGATGYKIGSQVARGPYDAAMENWKTTLGPLEQNMKLETEAERQGVARQRAGDYGKSVKSMDDYRRWQQTQPRKWEPTTQKEATDFELSKRTPPRPTAFEQYQATPNAYRDFQEGNRNPPQPRRTLEEERGLITHRANEAARTRRPLQGRVPARVPPAQQLTAEKMAIQQVIQQNQGFAGFVDPQTGLLKPIDAVMDKGGLMGFGGASDSEISLRRDLYRKALSEIDKKKKEILGQGQSGEGEWELEEEEE